MYLLSVFARPGHAAPAIEFQMERNQQLVYVVLRSKGDLLGFLLI